MRRKTRPKVVWLPTVNTNSVGVAARSTWSEANLILNGGTVGAVNTLEVPVVMDSNVLSEPLAPSTSLADIESSGYRLRRIVGKLYCFMATAGNPTSTFGVTAGFMVRRTSQNGISLASQLNQNQVDPADIDNSMDPWIWRRSWLLSANTQATVFSDIPDRNFSAQYPGGIAEGPHIDQKTARIVGPEERLVLNVSATCILSSQVLPDPVQLLIIYDLRVLASLRSNTGNRRNASR